MPFAKTVPEMNETFKMNNPDFKEIKSTRWKLMKYLKEHKDEDVLVMYIFAGHGIQQAGKQCMVINEYFPESEFYRLWNVETMIRDLGNLFPRSYHCAFFAACRETYS